MGKRKRRQAIIDKVITTIIQSQENGTPWCREYAFRRAIFYCLAVEIYHILRPINTIKAEWPNQYGMGIETRNVAIILIQEKLVIRAVCDKTKCWDMNDPDCTSENIANWIIDYERNNR